MCKRIGYEYYYEELFVMNSKSKYSCTSALYFQLDKQTIKDNCIFDYYYNKKCETIHIRWRAWNCLG